MLFRSDEARLAAVKVALRQHAESGTRYFTSEIGMSDVVALDNCPYYIAVSHTTNSVKVLSSALRDAVIPLHLSRLQVSL